ncbi:MAG: phosphatase PAP2 family protein [Eubacteriales bacterium]|nr:phosphatase PAP2 family protein [Eubacteriales bacterium]
MKYLKIWKENRRNLLAPILCLIWNESVFYGARILTKNRQHYVLTSGIDERIPLVTWTIAIYLICFLVWALTYVYIACGDRKEAKIFFRADIIGKTIALLLYLLMPTTMLRPEITGNGVWDILMRFLYRIDAPDNLFPSIHCMVSWFCWIGMRKRKEDCSPFFRYGTLVFSLAVCVSTLTTKQHVLADVFGGILTAELAYWISKKMAIPGKREKGE